LRTAGLRRRLVVYGPTGTTGSTAGQRQPDRSCAATAAVEGRDLRHTYTHTDTPAKPAYYAIDNATIELSNDATRRPAIKF